MFRIRLRLEKSVSGSWRYKKRHLTFQLSAFFYMVAGAGSGLTAKSENPNA